MTELKPCPFCGNKPLNHQDGMYECRNLSCPIYGKEIYATIWNHRPIEDDLKKQLEEAKELSIEMETIRLYTEFRQQLEIANEKINRAVKELNVALYTLNQDEYTKSWLVPILDILTKETQ